MTKTLKVIKPFYVMEVGDIFTLSQDGKTYTCSMEEGESNEKDSYYKHSSNFTISIGYAKNLIEEGFLAEESINNKSSFVNIFEEIKTMLDVYTEELNNIDEDMANEPACLKVEKQTVLSNLITVLNQLYSLKNN